MSALGEEANAGAGEIREAMRFDVAALERWMEKHVPGFRGPVKVSQFKGGNPIPPIVWTHHREVTYYVESHLANF